MTDDTTTDDGPARRLVSAWQGRFFEDFAVGDIYG
jgi:hypothetical protein